MTPAPLARLFQRLQAGAMGGACHALPALPPERPIYAIGDVHGCLGLLRSLLALIETDAAARGGAPCVILLGDMIDRGPDSAGVLELAMDLAAKGRILPIMGNHERMMLRFLNDPHRHAGWLDQGGFETLLSFGLAMDPADLRRLSHRRLKQRLKAHVPPFVQGWLAALPLGYHVTLAQGVTAFAHAGLVASLPLSRQPEAALLWGENTGLMRGYRLVHGHFVTDEPGIRGHRIGVDTGAWKTGRLSAVRLCQDAEPEFLCLRDARITRPMAIGQMSGS